LAATSVDFLEVTLDHLLNQKLAPAALRVMAELLVEDWPAMRVGMGTMVCSALFLHLTFHSVIPNWASSPAGEVS